MKRRSTFVSRALDRAGRVLRSPGAGACRVWPLLWLTVFSVSSVSQAATPPLRIAVAPFAFVDSMSAPESVVDASLSLAVARSLAGRLAQRPLDRVMAPDAFRAEAEYEPSAARVRQWAYNASVDTVVVGRVRRAEPATEGQGGEPFEIDVTLRSGHSGAEVGRHRVGLRNRESLEATSDRLAAAILEELGYLASEGVAAAPHRDPRSPEPPIIALPPANDVKGGGEEGGLAASFDLGKLREEAPIEIAAEEAEIVDRGQDRKLVFQRNVRVRQGDIRLESDLLEAEYRKGEPEPDRLIAKGSVVVDQGYRRAKCDRAVYLRLEQKLSCEGRAELVQGCDVVRGDSIEFDLAGDQAHVVGAASIVIRPNEDRETACSAAEEVL